MGFKLWGEQRFGASPTQYQYTGQYREPSLGIDFFNTRWYDPALGRFLSADSIVPAPGYPGDFDRYSYARNSPVRWNDPSGHCPWCFGAIIGGLVGGVNSGVTYAITNQGESFNGGEFAAALVAGVVAGALVGSGIGLVAGASTAATAVGTSSAAAIATASTTATSLIGAGTSAGVSGLAYMAQTPGNFETIPFVVDSAVAGAVGYLSPGQGLGTKIALETAGAEITYLATAKNPSLDGALASGIGGAVGGAFDFVMENAVFPTLDEFFRFYPGPIARTVGVTVDGIASNAGSNAANYYAQKKALEQ
jgi:RHS repeat-associated protein